MRSKTLILFVLAGCSKNVGELRQARSSLEARVSELKQKTTNLSGRREALDALDQRLAVALTDAGVTVDALNVEPVGPTASLQAQAPMVPPLSVWEGAEARGLRVEIAELQAKVQGFELAAGEVDNIERRTFDIENQLNAIAAGHPGHPAPASDRVLIVIGGGGSTRDAAEAALVDWERANAAAGSNLAALDARFPSLISSDTLRGLKPGFELAVLGYCSSADFRAVLPGLRRLSQGVYGREVTLLDGGAPTLACPSVDGTKCDPACEDSCDAALRMVQLRGALDSVEQLRTFLPPATELRVHIVAAIGDVPEPQVDRSFTVSRATLRASSLEDVAIGTDAIDCDCDGTCSTIPGGWSASFDWSRSGNQLYLSGVSVHAH